MRSLPFLCGLCASAVLLRTGIAWGRLADSTRLTEVTIDYPTLLGGGVPGDPFGKHSPEHVAGYYKLNRSQVRHTPDPCLWGAVRATSEGCAHELPWKASQLQHKERYQGDSGWQDHDSCSQQQAQRTVAQCCTTLQCACAHAVRRLCRRRQVQTRYPVQDAEMFYFFFESRKDPANDPVVLWMTGGAPAS